MGETKGKAWAVASTLLDILAIAILTLAVGYLNRAFVPFTKGYDAYGHISQIRLLSDYYPNINWNYAWYSGMPSFIGSYPPLFYCTCVVLGKLLSLTPEYAVILVSALSFCFVGIALYGFVRQVVHSRLAGLTACALLISSPAYWAYIIEDGHYPRVMGTMFLSLSLFFTVRYLSDKSRSSYIALLLSTAGSLSSHLLLGAINVGCLFLALLILPKRRRQKLFQMVNVLLPLTLSVAYFYLPYSLTPKSSGVFTDQYQPLPLINLFAPSSIFESLPFFLLPLSLALFFVWLSQRGINQRPLEKGSILVIGLVVTSLLIYATIGYFLPFKWYINMFAPAHTLYFISFFLAALDGLFLGALAASPVKGQKVLLAALFPALIILIGTMVPTMRKGIVDLDSELKREIQDILSLDPQEKNFRVGCGWDGGCDWINSRYDVPQTRGYLGQGVVFPAWQFWLEYSIWNTAENYSQTNFLLDWYGVKWFYNNSLQQNQDKFLSRPAFYTPMSHTRDRSIYSFQYNFPTPILSASTALDALHLGNDSGYDVLFRSIAHSNLNSQHVIALRGPNHLDDLTLDELSQFDLVILYGFDYRDQEKAFNLLADYVREGGGLIVEVNGSPLDNASSIPEPIPVSHTTATNYGTEWNFTRAEHEILEGIDLSAFGPAIYDGGPWGVSSAEEADIRDWAQPILFTNGHPIIVAGQYGQGRVVWTGMNLPYHILSYRNQEESRFLAQMIEWVAGEGGPQPDYEAHFIHPQRRVVKVLSPAKGVLFKESFFPNWHAYVGGRELKIYRAGPDFMYVALPKDTPYPVEVILEYKKSNLEWISLGISLATFLALAAYAIRH